MTLIIGLTGGIGSGKSTVSQFFSMLNVDLVDADLVARQVVTKGEPVLQTIAAHFGEQILVHGELNRSLLRSKIFQDDNQRKWLNALLHPLIHTRIMSQLAKAGGKYVLLDAPLLFENKLDQITDYNVVIDIDPILQIERVSARDGVSVDSVKAIISKQISREERLKKADFIINNNNIDLQVLKNKVLKLDKQLCAL